MSQPPQQQDVPGSTGAMNPKPDHGEESYRGCGRLEGKKTIITGADSGIGRAVAIAFAREGADVLISYLNEHDDARETAKWVEQAGRKAVLVSGDLSDAAHCREVVDRAVQEFGRIDVLVSNAAFQATHESIEDISDEEWNHTLATNLSAYFFLVKAAVPHMPEGGSIIGTTSVNSDTPVPELLAYDVTKGGIANMSRRAGRAAGREGHPGQQRGAGADLDAAHPGHHAGRAGEELRAAGAAGAARPARRGGPGLRAAGVGRGQLHLRGPDRGDRR